MTRRSTQIVLLFVLAALAASGAIARDATAAEVYGRVLIEDRTGEQRPIDRRCRIQIRTKHRTVDTITRAGGEYFFNIPERGPCELNLEWHDGILRSEVASQYSPARYDLIIHRSGGEYRLRAVRVIHRQDQPPDRDVDEEL
jgi:hypothetical protein